MSQFPETFKKFGLLLLVFGSLLLSHFSLLQLPYFWDEAGYYIPAAHDLLLTGDLIPHSTITNPHPPLMMAYLALVWKVFGYAPVITRTAMLLAAAFALLGTFTLARRVATVGVALASTLCVALYPVFFAQSSLAHVDLAAAAFTIWGLLFYVQHRTTACAAMFVFAGMAKETAIITPLALLGWELCRKVKPSFKGSGSVARGLRHESLSKRKGREPQDEEALAPMMDTSWWLLIPVLPLATWFAYDYHRTGHLFGNPEFFRYNVSSTLQPLRVLFALARRLWQLFGHMNLYVLTLAGALAMFFPPQMDDGRERERIAIPVQLIFAAVIVTHLIVFSIIGGAVLARYMLPAVPLVIIILVSTIRRRVRGWQMVITLVCAAFVLGLFVNPAYVFAPEDNLAYRDYVLMHQKAEAIIATQYPYSRVLTAWPASDELTKPYLGYVNSPVTVLKMENFTREELEAASQNASFDVALIFSLKYEPPRRLPAPDFWKRAQTRFFDDRPNTSPEAAAQILRGRIVFRENRGGQWIAIIEIPQIRNAGLMGPSVH